MNKNYARHNIHRNPIETILHLVNKKIKNEDCELVVIRFPPCEWCIRNVVSE